MTHPCAMAWLLAWLPHALGQRVRDPCMPYFIYNGFTCECVIELRVRSYTYCKHTVYYFSKAVTCAHRSATRAAALICERKSFKAVYIELKLVHSRKTTFL